MKSPITVIMLIFTAFIAGCCPRDGLFDLSGAQQNEAGAEQLWQLRLVHGGDQAYAGLLVTRRDGDDLDVALLDSTGIKIFAATVEKKGGLRETYCIEAARDKGLPGFLSDAVRRLFLEEFPKGCEIGGFTMVCADGVSNGNAVWKKGWLGVIPLWKAGYYLELDNPRRFFRATYSPLIGPDLILDRM